MVTSNHPIEDQINLEAQILDLLGTLGTGSIEGVAYDTAWVARIAHRYPDYGFEDCLSWLRQNQHEDGTWGASLLHYHDRFASTLAAIVALAENGSGEDSHLVKRGEAALWKLVSLLGRDDSDTVGFPVVISSLVQDAVQLGLDVPQPPIRYAAAYYKKVQKLLTQPQRDWRQSALSFSLEGLWRAVGQNDQVLESNHSVASSPAATAAFLFNHFDEGALNYLKSIKQPDGGIPALAPIDIFEITWSLSQLKYASVVTPDLPEVQRLLQYLWERWSPETGLYYSSYFRIPDLDITSASFILLRWGGFPANADIFEYFELDDHFCTYREEANPSAAAHLRLLMALEACPEHPKQRDWIEKAMTAICDYDENGSYWWDKWHASPYYVSSLATHALINFDRTLAASRLKWMLRTQNDDGGWGYLNTSTAEETAFAMDALLLWNREVEPIDPSVLEKGMSFLQTHQDKYEPLWISKGLYMPTNIVKSTILSALYQCFE